jgi:hypothetical protein
MLGTMNTRQNRCVRLNGGNGCAFCSIEKAVTDRIYRFIRHETGRQGRKKMWEIRHMRGVVIKGVPN